jgi:hypothetical protein
MTLRLAQLTLFILLLAAPAYADELVVNFTPANINSTTSVQSYTESGISFNGGMLLSHNSITGNNFVENNSFHVSQPHTIRIQWTGGGTFDFLGVDYVFGSGRSVFIGSNGVEMDLSTGLAQGFGNAFQDIVWLDWVHYGFGGEFGPNPLGLDNFRFNTNTVPTPEPATLILLGSGLLGVARAARKRRRA